MVACGRVDRSLNLKSEVWDLIATIDHVWKPLMNCLSHAVSLYPAAIGT